MDVKTSVDLHSKMGQRQPVAAPTVTLVFDDVSVVNAARSGDRTAFGQLYDRYARMVHGILLARVPHSEVDDLVQDVFLQALRRLNSLRDSAAFGGWLAKIARNRAVDFFRRSRETAEELSDDLPGHDGTKANRDALAVLSVIRTLPDTYRETLMLRLVEGMTGPEIAKRTGLQPASVRVNLHRGMKRLREKLGTSGPEPKGFPYER